jgi:hypothetical protein
VAFGPATGANFRCILRNCTFNLPVLGDTVTFRGVTMIGGGVAGSVIPTEFVRDSANHAKNYFLGVDLSALGSGKTIVQRQTEPARNSFVNCKLGASVTLSAAATLPGDGVADFINCDSADTNYRSALYMHGGDLQTETTVIRTGGASDGVTGISWKVTTNADAKQLHPFTTFPLVIWNTTAGSAVTVTVECRGPSVPNNDQVWMDIDYLGTSGFPISTRATTGLADILATAAACTSSSEAWGGGTSSFKLVKTITPQEAGPITVHVNVGWASQTVYIDPKVTLS